MKLNGLIIKGIGGFYYIEADEDGKIYECKARGKFRKEKITPYAGDRVLIDTDVIIDSEIENTAAIDEIYERRNYIIRPPVANLDNLFIISSVKEPSPDTLLIDKAAAIATMSEITPILVLTKTDLSGFDEITAEIKAIYDMAGIKCIVVSSVTNKGVSEVKKLLDGKISAFTGNSGVGKSTLLNALFPNFNLKTGETSQKLGRGRHTTREVELHKIDGGYVADTPGFSTFDMARQGMNDKEQLIYGFSDFMPYFGKCRFTSCTHTGEKGCAIAEAVNNSEIAKSRYQSYLAMYDEIKDIKSWQIM